MAIIADSDFQSLLVRVRQGDQSAATEFVRVFEPELRRVIRLRFTDPYLRRLADSNDICQSVMANFFVRAGLGQFQLSEPTSLLKLLAVMARNKVYNLARDRKREKDAQSDLGPEMLAVAPGRDPSPSQAIEIRELAAKARELLDPDEFALAQKRLQGRSWQEIAAETGESAEMLRKRYSRALSRVASRLGLSGDEIDE